MLTITGRQHVEEQPEVMQAPTPVKQEAYRADTFGEEQAKAWNEEEKQE